MSDGESAGGRVPVDSEFQKLVMLLPPNVATEVCRMLMLWSLGCSG